MKNSHKILIAVSIGVAIGGFISSLFASGKGGGCNKEIKAFRKKLAEKIIQKNKNYHHLEADIEAAIKEAVTENPEEYAR